MMVNPLSPHSWLPLRQAQVASRPFPIAMEKGGARHDPRQLKRPSETYTTWDADE
jgi:hypothetical protein